MTSKADDELGARLWEAQVQWACVLSPAVAEELMAYVSDPRRYGTKSLGDLLDEAMRPYDLSDAERHAYKMALGGVFGTRWHAKRRAMGAVPFAPVEAYEDT